MASCLAGWLVGKLAVSVASWLPGLWAFWLVGFLVAGSAHVRYYGFCQQLLCMFWHLPFARNVQKYHHESGESEGYENYKINISRI